MRRSLTQAVTAGVIAVLFLVLPALQNPAALAAEQPLSLSGHLFAPGGEAPLADAVLILKNRATGKVFSSAPTDMTGRYQVRGLPPGEYEVTVKTAEGASYVLKEAVGVSSRQATELSLSLSSGGEVTAGGAASASTPRRVAKASGAVATRHKALVGSLAGAGGVLAVGLLMQSPGDGEGSPFKP